MTWFDGLDVRVDGTYQQLCNANCAMAAHSVEEWFYRPGKRPPFLAPPVMIPRTGPVSTEVLPGYTERAVAQSARRRQAERLMTDLLETNAPRDRLRWVRPADYKAA
jgi:hypothetical protein